MAKRPNQQDQILELMDKVKDRKAKIAKANGKPHWLTNCSFSYTEGKVPGEVSLHVEQSIAKLISIAAFLKERQRGYEQAGAELEVVKLPAFTWNGSPVADWLSDIKTRIGRLQVADEQKELDRYEKALDEIVPAELRAKLVMDNILKGLNGNG